MSVVSSLSTIGGSSNKCKVCSANLKKSKQFLCIDCHENACKDHIRFYPDNCHSYCLPCFTTQLINQTNEKFEPQFKALKLSLLKAKEKAKQIKKEKVDKTQAIERLIKMRTTNLNNHAERSEKQRTNRKEEWDLIQNKLLDIENISISVNDAKSRCEISKKRMENAKEELTYLTGEFNSIAGENATLQTQNFELHEEINKYIPYERLRKLGCETCWQAIKKKFREDIKRGVNIRNSMMASVLAYRQSVLKSRIEQKSQPSNSQCCFFSSKPRK
jgi:hypothetical protein